jgi:NADPH-dependent 2,4-dienoyl-CoA reductase/sulfur reductase-like enzyme
VTERLVIIGGDAGGMSAASVARRLRPDPSDLEIVAYERGGHSSYSACGIPYLVGAEVDELDDLIVRTPGEFRENQDIEVRTNHEVTAIDVAARRVEVRDLLGGQRVVAPFDQLLIATGARPTRPDLPGIGLDLVHGVQTLDDAADLLGHAEKSRCQRVVVVGGGYIGLEMAEAFVAWGAAVTIVQSGPQVMRTLDLDMAELVTAAIRHHGIDLRLDTTVTGFEPGTVRTDHGEIATDLVVLGIGVTPNSELARDAGLDLSAHGAIDVDRRQRTSADGIWATGDCCVSHHLITGEPIHVALGTVANRQGRVAGINLGGGYARSPGVLATAVTKLCGTEIGRTGLTEREAAAAGFAVGVGRIESTTKAGYFPGAEPITVKVVAERGSGRLLGGQVVGGTGAAKRIDVLATAITAGLTATELELADLSYAPPFSPLWDPILIAARHAARAARTG